MKEVNERSEWNERYKRFELNELKSEWSEMNETKGMKK